MSLDQAQDDPVGDAKRIRDLLRRLPCAQLRQCLISLLWSQLAWTERRLVFESRWPELASSGAIAQPQPIVWPLLSLLAQPER